jgi:conjugal transfer mating pair stabilization protein TraN
VPDESLPLILMLHMFVLGTFIWFTVPACADSTSDYKAGADYAKQVQGSGLTR